jgi:hypothetical protein
VTVIWLRVLRVACADAIAGYGSDDNAWPDDAVVSLVATFNQGIILQRLVGVDSGHCALLQAVDGWLEKLEAKKGKSRRERPR